MPYFNFLWRYKCWGVIFPICTTPIPGSRNEQLCMHGAGTRCGLTSFVPPADTPRDEKMAGRILYLLASCSLALAEITQLQMTDCGNSYKDLFSLSIYCFKMDNFHIIYMY